MRLEQLCDSRITVLQSLLGSEHANLEEADPEWMLSGNEGRPASGTRLLRIVIGEKRPLRSLCVEVRRAPAHRAAMIRADVPDADVIGHDEENIGFLLFLLSHIPS